MSNKLHFIYVQPGSLSLYEKGGLKPLVVDFPEEVIHFGEIIDPEKYQKTVEVFLKDKITKGDECFIGIHPQLTFEEKFPAKSTKEEKAEQFTQKKKAFLEEIPTDPAHTVIVEKNEKDGITVIAVSSQLYSGIVDYCNKLNVHNIVVCPIAVIDKIKTAEPLGTETIKSIWDQVGKMKNYNLLNEKANKLQPEDKTPTKKREGGKKQIFFLLAALSIIGGSVWFAMSYIGTQEKDSQTIPENAIAITQTTTQSEQQTQVVLAPSTMETQQSSVNTEQTFSMKILYDVTQKSRAEAVKSGLQNLGFTQFAYSQAGKKTVPTNTLFFSSKVDNQTKVSVLSLMTDANYKMLTTLPSTETQDTDILIIIGK